MTAIESFMGGGSFKPPSNTLANTRYIEIPCATGLMPGAGWNYIVGGSGSGLKTLLNITSSGGMFYGLFVVGTNNQDVGVRVSIDGSVFLDQGVGNTVEFRTQALGDNQIVWPPTIIDSSTDRAIACFGAPVRFNSSLLLQADRSGTSAYPDFAISYILD